MDEFTVRDDVDKNKVYVSGLSMGGMGTFSIIMLKSLSSLQSIQKMNSQNLKRTFARTQIFEKSSESLKISRNLIK